MYDLTLSDSKSHYHGAACFYLGSAELFVGDSEKGGLLLNKALDISTHLNDKKLKGKVYNCLGIYEANVNANYYLAQQYFLRSLEFPGMDGSVYRNLAHIARLQKDSTGYEYARKCYKYGIDNKDPYYIYGGLISMTEFQIMMGKYEEAEATLQKARKEAETMNFADSNHLDLLQAVILSHLNKTQKSNEILLAIHDSIRNNYPIYLPELQLVIGKNYEKQGNLATSTEWLEKAIQTSIENSSSDYTGIIYHQLADNYKAAGNYQKAFLNMESAYNVQENAAKTERNRMIKERELTLKSINQEQQRQLAEQKARSRQIVIIILSLLLAVAISATIYVIVTMRKRHKLYEHIVQQNLNMLADDQRYRQRIQDLESQIRCQEEKTKSLSASREAKSREIFEALQSLMEKEQLFRNPQLTREDIIERLDTNSTYLTIAIKESVSMNYAQYINSFRIKEAIRILSDKNYASTPIKQISEEVGCNSLTTFYKLFQQATGISPSAFRKSAINM